MRISGGTAQRKRIKRCIDRSIVIMTCARVLQSNNLYWMSATIAAAGAGWKPTIISNNMGDKKIATHCDAVHRRLHVLLGGLF